MTPASVERTAAQKHIHWYQLWGLLLLWIVILTPFHGSSASYFLLCYWLILHVVVLYNREPVFICCYFCIVESGWDIEFSRQPIITFACSYSLHIFSVNQRVHQNIITKHTSWEMNQKGFDHRKIKSNIIVSNHHNVTERNTARCGWNCIYPVWCGVSEWVCGFNDNIVRLALWQPTSMAFGGRWRYMIQHLNWIIRLHSDWIQLNCLLSLTNVFLSRKQKYSI